MHHNIDIIVRSCGKHCHILYIDIYIYNIHFQSKMIVSFQLQLDHKVIETVWVPCDILGKAITFTTTYDTGILVAWHVMRQSIPPAPSPPGQPRGICQPCQSGRGGGL